MSDQPRPVWLTAEQREALYQDCPFVRVAEEIISAWDAAPADPTEAVFHSLVKFTSARGSATKAVLRALGMPE